MLLKLCRRCVCIAATLIRRNGKFRQTIFMVQCCEERQGEIVVPSVCVLELMDIRGIIRTHTLTHARTRRFRGPNVTCLVGLFILYHKSTNNRSERF